MKSFEVVLLRLLPCPWCLPWRMFFPFLAWSASFDVWSWTGVLKWPLTGFFSTLWREPWAEGSWKKTGDDVVTFKERRKSRERCDDDWEAELNRHYKHRHRSAWIVPGRGLQSSDCSLLQIFCLVDVQLSPTLFEWYTIYCRMTATAQTLSNTVSVPERPTQRRSLTTIQ